MNKTPRKYPLYFKQFLTAANKIDLRSDGSASSYPYLEELEDNLTASTFHFTTPIFLISDSSKSRRVKFSEFEESALQIATFDASKANKNPDAAMLHFYLEGEKGGKEIFHAVRTGVLWVLAEEWDKTLPPFYRSRILNNFLARTEGSKDLHTAIRDEFEVRELPITETIDPESCPGFRLIAEARDLCAEEDIDPELLATYKRP